MADSKFFDNQYKSYKNQVKSLQKDLTKLIRIRDSLTGDFLMSKAMSIKSWMN